MDIITSYYLSKNIQKKEIVLKVLDEKEKHYEGKIISTFKSCEKCGQDNYSCQCFYTIGKENTMYPKIP